MGAATPCNVTSRASRTLDATTLARGTACAESGPGWARIALAALAPMT
jgi:hypothetical protein